MNQRWRDRIGSYRDPLEVIDTSRYEVAEIADDATAKAFVVRHHYAASYPAARFRFGLRRGADLVGVAVFSHPCRDSVLTDVFGGAATESAELGRFVLLDDVAGNGETWFLARCFERLRAELRGVVAFSDPMPRTDAGGREVFLGHIGTIYQAHNGAYLGRASRRTLRLLPDGRIFSERAMSKIRSLERGWRACAELLVAHGAEPFRGTSPASATTWLWTWLPRLTRKLRHDGNHRYAWGLERAARRSLASLPYPKADPAGRRAA